MNAKNRLIAGILSIVTIASLSSCQSKENNHQSGEDFIIENCDDLPRPKVEEISIIESEDKSSCDSLSIPEVENEEKLLEEILKENLYDSELDYEEVLSICINNYENIMNNMDIYLKAIYMKMYYSDVPMATYLKELNNMVVFQQVPMSLPDKIWNESFEHLIKLQDTDSLFETYCDLAIYVHSLSCDKEHYQYDIGTYTCNDLQEELKLKLSLED